MRRITLLVTVIAMLSMATAASADPPRFPDFVPFDAGAEGVAVDNTGNVYASVGFPDRVEIRRVDPSGEQSVLASLPGSVAAGLAIAANGRTVYAAVGFVGVFAVDVDGSWELVPGTEAIVLPNGLALDHRGNLYVSETFSFDADDGIDHYPDCVGPVFDGHFGRGGVWVVPVDGVAQLLLRDDLLTGTCLPNPVPYPIGANGIAVGDGELLVVNTEHASVVAVPLVDATTAGTPRTVATVAETGPFGPWLLDGIALDVFGDPWATAVTGNALVHVDRVTGSYETVTSDLLDFPASLAFGTGRGERRTVFVTNLVLGPPGGAGPGVASVPVGVPGMPLP